MKTLLLAGLAAFPLLAAAEVHPYESLQNEIDRSIAKGIDFLEQSQAENGSWSDEKLPALTAMALSALAKDPDFDPDAELSPAMAKGLEFLRSQQKDDGGIYGKGLANYSTSTAVMALVDCGQEEDVPLILEARRFLINQQSDFDTRGTTDNKYDGGIGYGGTYAHSDLSNTHLALQALKASEQIAKSQETQQPQLNWEAALTFVSRCQNLPGSNDLDYASDDAENKGGFIYYPGGTKAGEKDLGDGRVALRSYGSMSYAGMLSLVYADLKADDPRLIAVKQWLADNYTVEENPGMEAQGLYYYFNTMAKALTAADMKTLTISDGKSADWRADLGAKLVGAQREDGSWLNDGSSRWFENDPVLVSSYSLMALGNIHHSIPQNIGQNP